MSTTTSTPETPARQADPRVHPLIVARWSPRAFANGEISRADLDVIFDAARWAPSAFNHQPWRFLWSRRDDSNWESYLALLMPFNALWAAKSAALVFIISEEAMQDKPLYSHSFDAGAAWGMLALQATHIGYCAHAMTGVDFTAAREKLRVPAGFRIEAAVALGLPGDRNDLPEALRAREMPSGRKPLDAFAYFGLFPN